MDLLRDDLQRYAEEHTQPEAPLLQRINRDTFANVRHPRMLSGHLQGKLLSLVSHLVRPHCILEIGTYTGYSAICLADGLAPGGTLHTIDVNEELEARARKHFEEARLSDRIKLYIGKAAEIIPALAGPFDLVFIDADKENYGLYYDLVIDKVNLGGLILADNVLWSGKVTDKHPDRETAAIVAFNEKIQRDDRVDNVLIPVRDGIMAARKVRP